jgi:tetratricopeptide (TPR) repeat protein
MPETAKILQFPAAPRRRALSSVEASEIARGYLDEPMADRSESLVASCLGDADVVLAILTELRARAESAPGSVAVEVMTIYSSLQGTKSVGLFDERDYFLGEAALLAGSVLRLVGRRDDAEIWLDRSEAAFRHVVNPGPALANISYARLTLHYDCGRYDRALELLPSLTQSFAKMGMEREALKCRFLEAMSLKDLSRTAEAKATLEAMSTEPSLQREIGLNGLVLVSLGELLAQDGDTTGAMSQYQQALPLLQGSKQGFAVAHLKALVGELLRTEGNLAAAVESFRSAIADYAELEMATFVAYLRIVLAETLIALSRNREAEWEIRMALPTIDERKMMPEGFAALALLRESIERRQTDSSALRDVRREIQARQ